MRVRTVVVYLSAAFALSVLGTAASAQGLEIGGGLGIAHVTGELSRQFQFGEVGLGGQGFVRYNFSNVVSARATGMGGFIHGADRPNPTDPFADLRNMEFSRIVLEASAVIEYNFLDYKERTSLVNWSPYFFGGFGLSAFSAKAEDSDYSRIQPVVPFGLGLKYRLTEQWNLEFEFGARKTFFDHLDKVSDAPVPNKLKPRYGNELDNDWYYFTGISVSYTFFSIPCPFNSY